MKYPFLIIFFSLILGCTSSPPKDNSDYKRIVGRTIKIHNLEIAQFDFPYKLNSVEASKAVEKLGIGWRVPTYSDFDLLIRYNDKIGNFVDDCYWTQLDTSSSVEYVGDDKIPRRIIKEKNQEECEEYFDTKHWVRAVRNF